MQCLAHTACVWSAIVAVLIWSVGPLYVCQDVEGDRSVESALTGCVQACGDDQPIDSGTCLDGSECSVTGLTLISTVFATQQDIPTDTVGVPLPASERLFLSLPPQDASYADYLSLSQASINHERALSLRSVILLV